MYTHLQLLRAVVKLSVFYFPFTFRQNFRNIRDDNKLKVRRVTAGGRGFRSVENNINNEKKMHFAKKELCFLIFVLHSHTRMRACSLSFIRMYMVFFI